MDKLMNVIEQNIQKTVRDYMLLISNKYNIDINELDNLWNTPNQISLTSSMTSPKPSPKPSPMTSPKPSPMTSPKPSSPSSPKNKDRCVNKCVYKFTKGKQIGEICNGGIKGDSQYCSKHIKFEETGQKDKKQPLPVSSNEKKSVDRLVRLNKDINKWWHVESKLVFKSDKEKIVVGVYKDNTYRDLCNDDIEECNKYGFRYEISQPPKIEIPIKKIEKPVKTASSIAKEINMSAKNIEDVISDMLDDTHIDSSDTEEELDEEELEEELDEEY